MTTIRTLVLQMTYCQRVADLTANYFDPNDRFGFNCNRQLLLNIERYLFCSAKRLDCSAMRSLSSK